MNTNGNAVNCSFQQCGMEAACSEQQNLCVEDGGTTQRTLRLQPSSYNSVPATTRVSCIEVLLLLVRGSGLDKVLILYRKQMGKNWDVCTPNIFSIIRSMFGEEEND